MIGKQSAWNDCFSVVLCTIHLLRNLWVSPGSPTGSPAREHLGILLVLQIHNIEPTYIISILKPFYRAALKKICSGIPDLTLRLKLLRTAIKNLTLLYWGSLSGFYWLRYICFLTAPYSKLRFVVCTWLYIHDFTLNSQNIKICTKKQIRICIGIWKKRNA